MIKNIIMMKYFVVLLSIFALLELATCRPSASILDGFTKENIIELPESEKTSKRSIDISKPISFTTTSKDVSLESVGGSSVSEIKALESSESFVEANAFRPIPIFRKRSVNEVNSLKLIKDNEETLKRLLRSLNTDDGSNEEMKTAENGLIFLPHFRSRNGLVRSQRSRRSAQDAVKTGVLPNVAETDDDLERAETIIFRPVFRSQLRPVRSVVDEGDLEGDDMELAANGLIFRPLFRTRQRGTGSA